MRYILGIDLGTSYFKFGIYDENLSLKGLSRVAVKTNKGDGNLCQLAAERFVCFLQDGISRACQQAEILSHEIGSIGYSSQANSFLLLDKNNMPLTPLILWPDTRFAEIHPKAAELWEHPDFLKITGIGIDAGPNFCINKLLWFKYCHTDLWQNVRRVMTISDYLTFLFTGRLMGDLGTASLLGLVDCKNAKWWDQAFEILSLDKALFSDRYPVGTRVENLKGPAAESGGLKKQAAFFIGSLDHHMAALGAGVEQKTDMSVSIGTVIACVNMIGNYKPDTGICISPWKNGKYCQLAFDSNGAGSIEWYQRKFAGQFSIEQIIKTAARAQGSDGLKAKRQAYQYSDLETAFENIKSHHSDGHFIHALIESSAESLKDIAVKLSCESGFQKVTATGGAAQSDLWLKICSEKLNTEVIRSGCLEPATRGAAMASQLNL